MSQNADADGWIETAKELPPKDRLMKVWAMPEDQSEPVLAYWSFTEFVSVADYRLANVTHWQPVRVPPPKKEYV